MTTCYLAPDPIQSTQFIPGGAVPANGGKLFFYAAGSSTKQTVYKDNAAGTAWSNPIVLDSGGNLPSGGEVWFPSGQTFKVVFAPSTDTDPPASPYWTKDNLAGMNDTSSTGSEWLAGPTPTYVSGTSFTLVGDQTGTFTAGRRLKSTNTAGTIYSTIITSAYGALTTITVTNDSGNLDSGLSAVSYALLAAANPSLPALGTMKGLPSSILRTYTLPNSSGTFALANDSSGTIAFPQGHLYGCGLSNNTTDPVNDINISSGVCRSYNNTGNITCVAMIKQLDANWALGTNAGMRYSGAAIANTTYHVFALQSAVTGVQDYYAYPGADEATAAAAFAAQVGGAASDYYFRRIGGIMRESGSTVAFTQYGDLFQRTTPFKSVDATNPGNAAVTRTLNTPTGIALEAWMVAALTNGTTVNESVYLSALTATDSASDRTNFYSLAVGAANSWVAGDFRIMTNTSSQIRSRNETGGASDILRISTKGWIDRRGRDA